jgi:hypothetical protein
MNMEWISGRTFEVPCTIEIEHTAASLHAYVELEGVDIRPGDEVRVHDAPAAVPFGERVVKRGRATVVRAGVLARAMAHVRGYLDLTELYEVGFSDGRAS